MDVKWPSLCFVLFVSNKSLVGYKVKMMDSDFEHFLKVEQKIKIPSEIQTPLTEINNNRHQTDVAENFFYNSTLSCI